MATVGTLLIDIAANTARLQKDMDQAKSTVDRAMAGIASAANVAKLALGALGIGATVAGLKSFVTGTAEAVGALKTLSEQTGVSVERLSAFRTVAKYADTDLASVGTGIQKLSKAMYEAGSSASSTPARIFQAMGVEVKTAEGTLRSADAVMQEVAKTLANMTDETQRVALAQQLFGKSGAQLLPFLLDLAKAGELNSKITTEQAVAAKEFDDNLKRLAASSNAWKTALVNDMIPTLNEMLTTLLRIKSVGLDAIFGLSGKETAAPLQAIDQWTAKIGRLKQQREEIANSAANKMPILRDIPGIGTSGDLAMLDRQIAFAEAKVSTLRKLVSNDIQALPALEEPPIARNIQVPDIDKAAGKAEKFDAMVEEARSLEMQNRILDEANDLGAKFLMGEQKKIDAAQILAAEITGQLNPALAEFNRAQERINQAVEAGTLSQEMADAALQQAAIRYQDAVASADAYRSMLDSLQKSYGTLLTPAEQYAKTLGEINALENAGRLNREQAQRQRAKAEAEFLGMGKAIGEDTKTTNDIARDLGMTFSSAFEDAITRGKKLQDVLQGIIQDMARIAIRKAVTEPGANLVAMGIKAVGSWLIGSGGAGNYSANQVAASGVGQGDMAGSSFAEYAGIGTRASGGPISAGYPYLVGEQGPELIVPGSNGTVVPNGALGGSTYYIDARGADPGQIARLETMIRAIGGSVKQQALAAWSEQRAKGGNFARA